VLNKSIAEGIERIWTRRGAWIDEAVVGRFKLRLRATFNVDTWKEALENTQQFVERERKIRRIQLSSLLEEMQNLVASLQTLKHPYLIEEVEKRYTQMEQERDRLESEIASLDLEKQQHISIEQAEALFNRAISEWDTMSQVERRNVLELFIQEIEASDYKRSGEMKLRITWKDGSSESIEIWHKPHAAHWTRDGIENLLLLVDSGATQLEVAALFPNLRWYQIFNEIKKHRGIVRFTPSWLGNKETYSDYVASGGRKGKASGSYWREDELTMLRAQVERQASQIEIMQVFPYRPWIRIKHRIRILFGTGVTVPLSGINQRLSYTEYVQQQKDTKSNLNLEPANANS
jgi:hypothetical protein